jgi:hypothetical protein
VAPPPIVSVGLLNLHRVDPQTLIGHIAWFEVTKVVDKIRGGHCIKNEAVVGNSSYIR